MLPSPPILVLSAVTFTAAAAAHTRLVQGDGRDVQGERAGYVRPADRRRTVRTDTMGLGFEAGLARA